MNFFLILSSKSAIWCCKHTVHTHIHTHTHTDTYSGSSRSGGRQQLALACRACVCKREGKNNQRALPLTSLHLHLQWTIKHTAPTAHLLVWGVIFYSPKGIQSLDLVNTAWIRPGNIWMRCISQLVFFFLIDDTLNSNINTVECRI